MGISLLALGKTQKAQYVFNDLIKLNEAFQEQHKHLFNELGISLRRRGLIEETLRYYFKAQEMSPEDENLQFNIARAYFEGDDLDNAITHLLNALEINCSLESALKFARFILEKELLAFGDARTSRLNSYVSPASETTA
jgi:tetratricopeptide (TPR) repeat protein